MLSFRPLVNLTQKALKHLLAQPLTLVHVGDHLPDFAHPLLLVGEVDLVEVQLGEDLLDGGFVVGVLAAVGGVEGGALGGGGALQSLVDEP